jgi:putative membrane protein
MNRASKARRNHLLALAVSFTVLWVILAIDPVSRTTWMLENALLVAGVAFLALTWRWLPLSRLSYTMIFLFLCLHAVGAHYTYSLVPYDDGFRALTGHGLNELLGWDRNHFDRLVHLLYGLLLAYPIREVFLRIVEVKGFWGYFLPMDLTLSTSAMYELIEWWAAMRFGGDLGMHYLGTQGDIWDAHKDMTLAALGAVIAMTVTALLNWRLQRDFAREWVDSLRVKSPQPLGEEAIARMLRDRASAD